MSDVTLNRYMASGTAAERAAFTPDPPSPSAGPNPLYLWYETDTGDTYAGVPGGSPLSVTWFLINPTGAQSAFTAPFVTPSDSGFSWVNQGSATIDTTNNRLTIAVPNEGATGYQWRMRVKTAPSRPYTLTAAFLLMGYEGGGQSNAGIIWRESSSGKLHIGQAETTVTNDYHQRWGYYTDPTTYGGASRGIANGVAFSWGEIVWMKFAYTSGSPGTRTMHFSTDGFTWVLKGSEAGNTDIVPDQIGFGCSNSSSATDNTMAMTVLSWSET